jgi:hypothetical protein
MSTRSFGIPYWINSINKEPEFMVAKKYSKDSDFSLFYHESENFAIVGSFFLKKLICIAI